MENLKHLALVKNLAKEIRFGLDNKYHEISRVSVFAIEWIQANHRKGDELQWTYRHGNGQSITITTRTYLVDGLKELVEIVKFSVDGRHGAVSLVWRMSGDRFNDLQEFHSIVTAYAKVFADVVFGPSEVVISEGKGDGQTTGS